MSFLSLLVGVNFSEVMFMFLTLFWLHCLQVSATDLTLEDREVKWQLSKCRSLAYSDLIRSNIPGSLGVSPSCSPHSRSLPPIAMETSPGGPLAVKPTRGELQAYVELLAKKRKNVKHKA